METSVRLFQCTRCHKQVLICTFCDRGNIYCDTCALGARQRSTQAAGKRYQISSRGRIKHIKRQRRYSQRLKNLSILVTHQGSQPIPNHDSLFPSNEMSVVEKKTGVVCHFCNKPVSLFIRSNFSRHHCRQIAVASVAWPNGP